MSITTSASQRGISDFETLSRRDFIQITSLVAGGLLAGGCGLARTQITVDRFLRISTVLTGFSDLNSRTAQTYLDALTDIPGNEKALSRLYKKGGFDDERPPRSYKEMMENLTGRRLQDDPELKAIAADVARCWYRGIYSTRKRDGAGPPTPEGKEIVADFDGSLAWRSVRYTHPVSRCGSPGDWSRAPADNGFQA